MQIKIRPTSVQIGRRYLKMALLFSLTIVALAALVLNRGVRFSFYNFTTEVKIADTVDFARIEPYLSNSNISAVDRNQREIRWQGTDIEALNQFLSNLQTDLGVENVNVSKLSEVISAIYPIQLLLMSIIIVTVVFGFSWFIVRANFTDRKIYLRLFALAAASWVWGVFAVTGVLSLVSVFYELSEYLALVMLLSFVWGMVLFWWLLTGAYAEPNISAVWNKFSVRYSQGISRFLGVVILWIVVLIVGLGPKVVVDSLLLVISLLIVGFGFREFVPSVYTLRAKISKPKFRSLNSSRRKQAKAVELPKPAELLTEVSIAKGKKNKSKKDKSKSKHRRK